MTPERALHLFEYKDGSLYWKNPTSNRVNRGDKISYRCNNRYLMVQADKKMYLVHRMIFLMHHGFIPQYVDHIDGDKENNKIENLRKATKSENSINRPIRSNNKTGFKGVCWDKKAKKYLAQLSAGGCRILREHFDRIEDAAKAYNDAAIKYHHEYRYHGS